MDTLVAVVYRPPDAPIESFRNILNLIQQRIDKLSEDNRTPDIYILGDFNLPNIDWSTNSVQSSLQNQNLLAESELLDFTDKNFLTQMIGGPTRGDNTIDLILTNKPQDTAETRQKPTQLSDHLLVELLLGFNPLTPRDDAVQHIDPHSFRTCDYHNADFDGMNELLGEVDWKALKDLCYDDDDGSDFLELIRLTVLQVTLLHSPKKAPSSASKKKTPQMRNRYAAKRKRRKLNARIHAIQLKNPSSQNIQKLTDKVNLLNFQIKELIVDQMNQKEMKAVNTIKTNPKFFYSFAKKFAKTKSSVAPIRDETGRLCTEPSEKAQLLQNQYVKVFSDPKTANMDKCTAGIKKTPSTILDDISFTLEDIAQAIKELDPYSSAPDEDIPARILTKCSGNLSEPLFLLWKDSMHSGIIPPSLKKQFITPIYKKGDRTMAANYRPVSITSHVIKIFERVIRNQLVDHMESNSLISPNQHGFRKRRSCLTQLLDHVDTILKALNNGEEVDVIYLDYAKAFDKVDHDILLAKARKYGIRGKLLTWLTEFLKNRLQTVVVEGTKSSFEVVVSGVPQGTVLGPILFILYIDDQLESLETALGKVFADDTKLIGRIVDILTKFLLQDDLHNVVAWAERNNMQLNESKFEILNYSLNNSMLLRNLPFVDEYHHYSLTSGATIEPSHTVRDLGVLLSDDCSWTPHIRQMLQTSRKMAAWVLSVFSSRSPFLMLTLFKTMVRSRLEYCCPVWNPAKISDIEAIESIQRNFTRRINSCKDLNYWERLKRLGLLSLQRRRERYIIILTWKIMHGLAPNDIHMQFKDNPRLGRKAVVPPLFNKSQKSTATHYENSFAVKAARLWNILPKEVTSQTTLGGLKETLGNFLDMFPDNPPAKGYTATNNNSLLEWTYCQRPSAGEKGGRT